MKFLSDIQVYIIRVVDLLYSLVFCLRCFPFADAIKIPVNISHQVKVSQTGRGAIVFLQPIQHNMLYLGHQGFTAIPPHQGIIHIEKGCHLVVEGKARFAQGVRIWIENGSKLQVGDNFYANVNCFFRAYDDIIIGKDVLLGWNIAFNTSDGHSIIYADGEAENHQSIHVGEHVWIASDVTLSKGVNLPDGTIVAQRSLVCSQFSQPMTVIGGIPAKILKKEVNWKI